MSRKIIIVDDQLVFRQSLAVTLKTAGDVEIIGEASNGEEFLTMLKTKTPEIVFMDIEMPVMNGIQATQKAIKMYPNLLIIGLSLYDNESYVEKLLDAGARGYLLKTSDNHTLFQNIIKYPDAEIFFSEDLSYRPNASANAVRTIMLVDDFETNVIVMKSSLQIAGFHVKTSNNPFIALKELEDPQTKIDLLVVDYRMPGMNGAQLVAEVRKMPRYQKIPILMLSSETAPEKKLEAKNAGATGWIVKPFQLDKFLRIIEKAL
jgi:DNA-binding NarL/FixJ family response regulator